MKSFSFNRRTLYEKLWSEPISSICAEYEIWEEGLMEICWRLNVPYPEKLHWKRISQGKNSEVVPLPQESHGTETVTLYKRNDDLQKVLHFEMVHAILQKIDSTYDKATNKIVDFDKLVLTTKESIQLKWDKRNDYWEKNKALTIGVSPERLLRALNIFDLIIKVLRYKKYDLKIEDRNTFVVIGEERIQISLSERNKRVEFKRDGRFEKKYHPTGILVIKKEGRSYDRTEWKDGKIRLEDQLPKIVEDWEEIAREQIREHERMRKAQEEREEQARLKFELEKRQKDELSKFRQLLFDAHRYSVSNMLREYIDKLEENAILTNSLNDEKRNWIEWARKKADWFDPSAPSMPEELLNGIDIENLRIKDNYTSYFGSSSYEQTKDNFWKPWWSR